jgi:hypothetical protein
MQIFGSKGREVTGDWVKFHNKEVNNLFFSPSSVMRTRWAKYVVIME